MNRRGFTALELIIVMAIIMMLVVLLGDGFVRSRETARRVGCLNSLQHIGVALHQYTHDYDGRFPHNDNDYTAMRASRDNQYMIEDMFWCPSDPYQQRWQWERVEEDEDDSTVMEPGAPSGRHITAEERLIAYSSYVFKGGLTNEDGVDTIMVGEIEPWHGDLVNVLYVGGHVKSLSAKGYTPVVEPPVRPEQFSVKKRLSEPVFTFG